MTEKQRLLNIAWLVGLVILLSACASRSTKVEFYTLSTIATSEAAQATSCEGITIGVGPISWPKMLERPQIVTRSDDHRVMIDEFHRWSGSLQEDFSRTIVQNLSLLLANDHVLIYPKQAGPDLKYRIDIDIQQFDGKPGDAVILKAIWRARNPVDNSVLMSDSVTIQAPVATENFAALVAAQSTAVGLFAKDLAVGITGLCSSPDGT